ncbi:MAG TPA: hypothetical protein VH134_14385 [Candidatus Dormibacteraeota bacterium]|nr:hypothetical protein [Candidatus Dormibacteraeota bacterium]
MPTPLRMARAIALFQGWAAGLGVVVMLGVAVIAAGGLRNGAFVALALLFLAGDVLAVSCAVVVAARRLGEGAAWARLLLDVVEGVTIAVGLVAILLGTGILGLLGVVIGVSVIVCLHMPSANAMFEGKPIVPWEVYARAPRESSLPVPTLPRMPRSGMARPLSSDPRPAPAAPPAWQTPARTSRYSWETAGSPLATPDPAATPTRPAAAEQAAAPPATHAGPPVELLPLLTPPVVPPPEEPPGRPFVVPPLEQITDAPRYAIPPAPEAAPEPAVRPFVVPDPDGAPAASGPVAQPAAAPVPAEPAAPAPAAPAPVAPASVARPPVAPAPPAVELGRWAPRQLPPVAAATTTRQSCAPQRTGTASADHRTRSSAPRRSARSTPAPPTWGWRKVVIAASLLGAVGGGTLSAVELLAGGGGSSRLPDTGQAPLAPGSGAGVPPVQHIPRQGARDQRSEPAAAGGVTAVTVSPEGPCTVGGGCTVTVRVDLEPHQDELVAWTIVVVDRCSSQKVETAVTGIPAPGSYRYVLSTNQVTIPAWRSPQILAVTTSPARASSPAIDIAGATGC